MKDNLLNPYYEHNGIQLWLGDCRDVLPALSDCSVDSIVTDPPYELGFMGKSWDRSGIAYQVEVWRECLRVLKHGGHLLAFGGSRTYHRLACAIEDAGFEIRDQIQWIYGSGFPKSLDVSKAIDAAAGAEREVIGQRDTLTGADKNTNWKCSSPRIMDITSPTTDAAKQWSGWGTALKPAHEILTLAYRPHEYDVERDIISANLSLLEARLWLLLPASIAETSFGLSPQDYIEACGSAQINVEEWRSIQADLLGQMDTSRCVSVMSTCLNTVRSWKSILDALCEVVSTSTIETKTSLITDLRILNYLLSQTTPSIIIKAASQADGQALNALTVAQHFAAARLKLNGILTLSALDAATSKAHTLHRAGVEADGIVMARKPLEGTVAANVLKHGTGGINIDGCRIAVEDSEPNKRRATGDNGGAQSMFGVGNSTRSATLDNARWPANVIHDGSDEVVSLFPNDVGANGGAGLFTQHSWIAERSGDPVTRQHIGRDKGNAARFFYCPKASKEDREEGLEDLPIRSAGDVTDRKDGSDGLNSPRAGAGRTNGSRNHHPTVKPTELMRYLVRLVTPPNGAVLDPFCGSGSTGKAAMLEGLQFIGIELSAEYCELAQRRIEVVTRQGSLFTTQATASASALPLEDAQKEFWAFINLNS